MSENPKIVSYDTESSYAKDRDIRSLGVAGYVRRPETDHYLVSSYSADGAWVGSPAECPWNADAVWISHNAAYDSQVIAELRRRGIPIPAPVEWNCTADMAAYLQSPRSLADASRELLGIELDKSVRGEMKGKDYHSLDAGEKVRWAEYALLDAKACYLLWQQHSHKWPEHERAVSRHTAMTGARGIGIDLAAVTRGIELLEQHRWEAEQRIPWAADKPASSPLALKAECQRLGLMPPGTTEEKSEIFQAWIEENEENEEKADFVRAVGQWRRANRLLKVLEAMRTRTVDDRLRYGLKYFGATHTGRWSGDAGLNLQNLPRKPYAGVDARACLVPGPGKKLVVADYAQIEARVSVWLAGDEATLEMLRGGMDIYESHARRTMGYADPRPLKDVDNEKRQFAKCRVLALGFGLGAVKFQSIVKQWTGMDISASQAKQMVDNFRRTNPGITGLWSRLERGLRDSRGGDFATELPSGRSIRYMDVAATDRQLTGKVELGGPRKFLYGGLLMENLVQATAREIFAAAILRVEAAGIPVVLHCHDELVCEVDAGSAEEAREDVEQLMSAAPEWAEGLPIAAEASVKDFYGK